MGQNVNSLYITVKPPRAMAGRATPDGSPAEVPRVPSGRVSGTRCHGATAEALRMAASFGPCL